MKEVLESPLGEHGSKLFYKQFTIQINATLHRSYLLGSFYFVQRSPDFPVSIAEIQLIWSKKNSIEKFASVKLYFKPEKPEGYGKDEVLVGDRQVVVKCSSFHAWQCCSSLWCSENSTNNTTEIIVKILSFPQYCRFSSYQKLVSMGVQMSDSEALARGAVLQQNNNVMILFSRSSIDIPNIEEFSPTQNIPVPQLRGRPRKWKNQMISSIPSKLPKCDPELFSDAEDTSPKEDLCSTSPEVTFSTKVSVKEPRTDSLENVIVIPDDTYKEEKAYLPITKADRYDMKEALKKRRQLLPKPTRREIDEMLRRKEETCKQPVIEVLKTDLYSGDWSAFLAELYNFMSNLGTPIVKVPIIGYVKLDLHRLFVVTNRYGGYDEVSRNRQWREIYETLGHYNSITNSATMIRKAYESLLLPFESHLKGKKEDSHSKDSYNTNKSNQSHQINALPSKLKTPEFRIMISPKGDVLSRFATNPQVTHFNRNNSVLMRFNNSLHNETKISSNSTNCEFVPSEKQKIAFRSLVEKRKRKPTKQFCDKIDELHRLKQHNSKSNSSRQHDRLDDFLPNSKTNDSRSLNHCERRQSNLHSRPENNNRYSEVKSFNVSRNHNVHQSKPHNRHSINYISPNFISNKLFPCFDSQQSDVHITPCENGISRNKFHHCDSSLRPYGDLPTCSSQQYSFTRDRQMKSMQHGVFTKNTGFSNSYAAGDEQTYKTIFADDPKSPSRYHRIDSNSRDCYSSHREVQTAFNKPHILVKKNQFIGRFIPRNENSLTKSPPDHDIFNKPFS